MYRAGGRGAGAACTCVGTTARRESICGCRRETAASHQLACSQRVAAVACVGSPPHGSLATVEDLLRREDGRADLLGITGTVRVGAGCAEGVTAPARLLVEDASIAAGGGLEVE